MRNTKIKLYKGTAAACVAAVAMSSAIAPSAHAQTAPAETAPAAAPEVPAPAPNGPATPPAALDQLPPAPTPEQIQTSILQIIDLSRTAIAFGAEGLRIAFDALNAAEQAVVAADNNYRVAEAEHGPESPEAVTAEARKDIAESQVETAGLKGDEEAAVVATPESQERRAAASVAPILEEGTDGEDGPDTDAEDSTPEPSHEVGEAIGNVRTAQEAYTAAAQAERDLLKRSDANPATIQELRAAAEETRLAEEALTAAVDELEVLITDDTAGTSPAGNTGEGSPGSPALQQVSHR